MSWNVKGTLFVDYVRMLRATKGVFWPDHFEKEDVPYLTQRIEPDAWYPMAAFERLGLEILELVADGDLEAVRAWGHITVRALATLHGELVVEGDPRESVMRFHVMRRTLFDFEAATILRLHDGERQPVRETPAGPDGMPEGVHETDPRPARLPDPGQV